MRKSFEQFGVARKPHLAAKGFSEDCRVGDADVVAEAHLSLNALKTAEAKFAEEWSERTKTLRDALEEAEKPEAAGRDELAEIRADLSAPRIPGAEALTADEMTKLRARAALSLMRPPERLSETSLRALSELKAYLTNGLIRPWLPRLIRDFLDARVGDKLTWKAIEDAMREYICDGPMDVEVIRDALDHCTHRTNWTPSKYRG